MDSKQNLYKQKLKNHLYWLKERGLTRFYLAQNYTTTEQKNLITTQGNEQSEHIFVTHISEESNNIFETEDKNFLEKILTALNLKFEDTCLLAFYTKNGIHKEESLAISYKDEAKKFFLKQKKRNIIFLGKTAYDCFFYERKNWQAHQFKIIDIKKDIDFKFLILPDLKSIQSNLAFKKKTWNALKKLFSLEA